MFITVITVVYAGAPPPLARVEARVQHIAGARLAAVYLADHRDRSPAGRRQ
jgi:hypothetical protein